MGSRKALLIGCNYPNSKGELKGCVNDVKSWYSVLTNVYNWSSRDIRVLTDQQINITNGKPTKSEIMRSISDIVRNTRSGDAIFFQFSGHGAQLPDTSGLEEDGLSESILPTDFKTAKVILDRDLFEALVAPLPDNVKLTCILDCCHSGTGLDLPFIYGPRLGRWRQAVNPYFVRCDAILISGCADHDTSADVRPLYKACHGALTGVCVDIIESHAGKITYATLMNKILSKLKAGNHSQVCQLSATQKFEVDKRIFDIDTAIPNSNSTLGQVINEKFKPSKPEYSQSPLVQLLIEANILDPKWILFGTRAVGFIGKVNRNPCFKIVKSVIK